MTIEARIKRISEASGLSEKEVRDIIEKKKEEAAGLLTDHGAIYALEKEHGISESGSQPEYKKLSELKIGENNVNVLGAIKEIRPIKKFNTQKRSGQLARLVIADESDEKPVILWDKTADLVNSDKIKIGSTIAIRNAYTKESLDKKPEIHVGGLSRILIDPKNVDEKLRKALPDVEENLTEIAELKKDDIASVLGRILYLYPKSEFQRSDGRTGQRASLILEDKSGKTRVVLWDSNAENIEKFSEGDTVKIENGQVREGTRGSELHIGNRGRILPSDEKIDLPEIEKPEEKTYKLAEIEPDLQNIQTAGRVMRMLPIKEFSSGERSGKLASIILVDDTGISRIVLWNEKTDHIKEINQGDVVLVRNAYAKEGLNGETELHISSRGIVQINPKDVKLGDMSAMIGKNSEERKISELKPDDRNVSINGKIEDVDESQSVFEICSECGSRVENVAGEWICDVCGDVTPAYGMVVSISISDGKDRIRAVFYRDLAEALSGLNVTDSLNMIGQSGDELAPIRQIRDDLLGRKITVTGNVRYNEYQDKLELIASSVETSESNTAKKSASKTEDIPEDVPAEVLKDDEDIEVEEISLDE